MQQFKIDFKSDVLFKYTLSDDKDSGSLFLLNLIIKELIGIDYTSLRVLNPDIEPTILNDKEIVLDVLIEDNHGHLIDVEMQRSDLSTYLSQRFQFYGAKLLVNQMNEGDTYALLNPVFQVIFVDDISPTHPCLKEVYTSRNDRGDEEMNNLIHRIYIFLPYINEIKKTKPLDKFTTLEKMIYIFANSIDNDIIKVKEKVVDIMERKLNTFTKDKALEHLAMQRYMGKWVAHMEKEDAIRKGTEEGITKGMEKGIAKGREVGKIEGIIQFLNDLLALKFPNESLSFINNYSLKQLNSIKENIFKVLSLSELREIAKDVEE